MNIITALFSAILFFILSPNVLLRLPKNGSKFTVAAVHAVVFGFILYFVQGFVHRMSLRIEGFSDDQCIEGSNEDEGNYYLVDPNDPTSCKSKMTQQVVKQNV